MYKAGSWLESPWKTRDIEKKSSVSLLGWTCQADSSSDNSDWVENGGANWVWPFLHFFPGKVRVAMLFPWNLTDPWRVAGLAVWGAAELDHGAIARTSTQKPQTLHGTTGARTSTNESKPQDQGQMASSTSTFAGVWCRSSYPGLKSSFRSNAILFKVWSPFLSFQLHVCWSKRPILLYNWDLKQDTAFLMAVRPC